MDGMKINVTFAQGVALATEMVKHQLITDEAGKDGAWISNRLNGRVKLSDSDLQVLENTLERVGARVGQMRVLMCEYPEAVAAQLKELQPFINMRYLYERTLNKGADWWGHRMRNPAGFPLTEDEVLKINLALVEMGAKLRALSLIK